MRLLLLTTVLAIVDALPLHAGEHVGTTVIVEGQVYQAKQTTQPPRELKADDQIGSETVIETQPRSRATVLFDTTVLTVGERTRVTVQSSAAPWSFGGPLTFRLDWGTIRVVTDERRNDPVQIAVPAHGRIVMDRGAAAVWITEGLVATPEGRLVPEGPTTAGILNIGHRESLTWQFPNEVIHVPAGSAIVRQGGGRPETVTGTTRIAQQALAMTEFTRVDPAGTPKEQLRALVTPDRTPVASVTRGAVVPRTEPLALLHIPPAVVSGLVPTQTPAPGAASPIQPARPTPAATPPPVPIVPAPPPAPAPVPPPSPPVAVVPSPPPAPPPSPPVAVLPAPTPTAPPAPPTITLPSFPDVGEIFRNFRNGRGRDRD